MSSCEMISPNQRIHGPLGRFVSILNQVYLIENIPDADSKEFEEEHY